MADVTAPAAARAGAAGATGRPAERLSWWLAGLVAALQIPYPLVHGRSRDVLTVAAVLAFCAASVLHAASWRGRRFAGGLLAVAAGGGLLAEAVGVHTGVPFGSYRYGGSLGPKVIGVPVVIPLAWAMMAYPALLAGRCAGAGAGAVAAGRWARRLVTALTGGLLLATWDLFLDPQMVAAGHWRWAPGGGPALNGVPLSNLAGWLAVGTILVAALDQLPARPTPSPRQMAPGLVDHPGRSGDQTRCNLPPGREDDRLPFALLGWTYASSLLANVAFFGRPAVALAGGVGMGAVLLAVGLAGRRAPAAAAP